MTSWYFWRGWYPVREQSNSPAYDQMYRTLDGTTITSKQIAQNNIRALTGKNEETDRNADTPLTETLKWLAKRNMVSAGVRQRIETLLKDRWDALKLDASAEWTRLLKFAQDSIGVQSNADRAVNSYLDRLEQALDNQ
jgi:hypothetical protein